MNGLLSDLEKRSVFFNEEDSVFEFDREKFAELIVRECMDVVAKKCASPTAYNALAEHFGVEE